MRTIHRVLGISAILGGLAAFALSVPTRSDAADHGDSPSVGAVPESDITDLFAWINPAGRLVLVMGFTDTTPSDTTQYVFHVGSGDGLLTTGTTEATNILCRFDASQNIECWAGDDGDYVTGDASDTAGLDGVNGKMKVFWGERNDPFFFNVEGFVATVGTVLSEAGQGNVQFDSTGCPVLDSTTSATLVDLLGSDGAGGAADDGFDPGTVGALVIELDVDLVNAGGDILAVWGATYAP